MSGDATMTCRNFAVLKILKSESLEMVEILFAVVTVSMEECSSS